MTHTKIKWRLLKSGRDTGANNMALDEALLQEYSAIFPQSPAPPPTLRFYGWSPACLSLGYAQRAEREVNFEACKRLGIDWVRRPTGGRAILHDAGELTYSLTASINDPLFSGGVLETYRKISGGLLEGLGLLGARASLAGKEARGSDGGGSAACFDAPSAYEITFEGKKLVGSAQARRGSAFMQQGTILLAVDVPKLFEVLNPPPRRTRQEAISQVSLRLTALNEVLNRPVNYEEAQEAFAAGFASHFGVELKEDRPGPFEEELAGRLKQEKYENLTWNLQKQRPLPAFR